MGMIVDIKKITNRLDKNDQVSKDISKELREAMKEPIKVTIGSLELEYIVTNRRAIAVGSNKWDEVYELRRVKRAK